MKNVETGVGKGFGFVRFVTADSAAVRAQTQRARCALLALSACGFAALRRRRWST